MNYQKLRYEKKRQSILDSKAKFQEKELLAATLKSDDFYQTREWLEFRIQVLARFESRCFACGVTPSDGAVIHVDHIKPRYLYPELAFRMSNMQLLCRDCNFGKGLNKVRGFKPILRRAAG